MAKPDWMPQRLYQWVKPRSLLLHFAYATCSAGCLIAMWWQIQRAAHGNALSYLYSVEWPTFVVVGGIGWWQLFHDTPEMISERRAFHRKMRAASAAVVARTLPRSATALTVESRDSTANRLGAGIAPGRALGDGSYASSVSGPPADIAYPGGASIEASTIVADTATILDVEGGDGDEMTEYNRYLALLAVKGKAKTWRNPHGT